MKYEQMEMDLRLDYEKSLKDNLGEVVKFAGEQMAVDMDEKGTPLSRIRNKQEAYGIAAQAFVKVCTRQKACNALMTDFLKMLDGDADPSGISGQLYNAGLELAQEAVIFSAHAFRILSDLYGPGTTPLEQYMNPPEEDSGDEETEG